MEPVNWLSCKSKYLQSTDTACNDAFKGPHVMPPLASTHSSSAKTMTPGRPQVHNHSPQTTWLSGQQAAARCAVGFMSAVCTPCDRGLPAAASSRKCNVLECCQLPYCARDGGGQLVAMQVQVPATAVTMTQPRRRTSHTHPSPRALSPLTLRAEGWVMTAPAASCTSSLLGQHD